MTRHEVSAQKPVPSVAWYLESHVEGKKRLRLPLYPLPFVIGRRHGLHLTLPWESVSKEHAEIYEAGEELRVRDLRSTNGTYVQHKRITDVIVREGDIIHIAEFEFRLCRLGAAGAIPGRDPEAERGTAALAGDAVLPHQFVSGTRELGELLRQEAVAPVFQPIVKLPGREVSAYEVLGRGRHQDLPENPAELFRVAASVGVEAELSRLFRRKALQLVGGRTDLPGLFLDTHPAELDGDDLIGSLREMRLLAPSVPLTLQIHQSALAEPSRLASLRAALYELHIGLAYDDFRTSQARLLELADYPPDFLKFEQRFVRGIEGAPPTKRRVLTALVSAARDLMVQTVAEGVETAAEADVCAKMGFTHAQGRFFGGLLELDQV